VLFLLVRIARQRYALEAGGIEEVLPLVEVRSVPRAPAALAGMFECRGAPVPLVDLSALAAGVPAQRCLSTRILLVRLPEAQRRPVGLIAGQATRTARIDAEQFRDPGLRIGEAPYLGPVASFEGGLLQRIELEPLLRDCVAPLLDGATDGC
jgi:chemotaxis-related protein WspB